MADKYVLQISKPGLGKDVSACSGEEFAFDSERDCLKVPLNGIGTSNSSNVNHGLAYIPIFFACERYTVGAEDRVKVVGTYNGVKCNSTQLVIGVNCKYYFFYKAGA